MATHSSILAWRITWTEKPGRLQSMGSQRAGHDWATNTYRQWNIIGANRKWLSSHEKIWRELKCILVSEGSWYEETAHCMIPSIWPFGKGRTTCFPCSSAGRESACHVVDLGSVPRLRKFSGEEKGYPTHSSILAWRIPLTIVHGVAKNWT